jgi:O-antigen ligase
MLQEDKQILWRTSAALIGMALPSLLLGKGIMYVLLLAGMLAGMFATKDESLRVTLKMLMNSKITLTVIVLLACLLVGVPFGINPEFAWESWVQLCLGAVSTGLLFVVMREMPGRHLETLLKVLSISVLVAASLALLDALLGDPRLSGALHGADKALTPYRLNFMSSVLAVLLPFVWARLMVKSREGEPFAVRVGMLVAVFSIVVTLACGGRAGWAGMVAGAAVFLGLAGRYHGMVIHAKGWLLGAASVALGLLVYVAACGWQFVTGRVFIVGEMTGGRGALSGRLEVWHAALVHLFDKPLFGIGVMNFRNLPEGVDLHPHNWLLQMLLEGGFVSTVVFVILLYFLIKNTFELARGSLYGVAGLAGICAFLVAGLANTSIFNLSWLVFLSFVSILGWRAGWGGASLKKRRRQGVVVKPIGR